MNEKDILDKYKQYLKEDVGLKSFSTYCSNMSKVFQVIGKNDPCINILNITLLYALKPEKRGEVQSFVYDLLIDAIEKGSNINLKKQLRDGKSALVHFWDFLDAYVSEFDETVSKSDSRAVDEVYKALKDASSKVHVSFITLGKKEFRGRLMTQFRTEFRRKVSGTEVCYPIKTIRPMLNKRQKEKITRRFNKQIDDTEIIVSANGEIITVGAIEEMRYAPGVQCEVTGLNGVTYKVYSRREKTAEIVPLICDQQGEISRDHKYPIKQAMADLYHEGKLCYLKELTEAIYNYDKTTIGQLVDGDKGIADARKKLLADNPQFNEEFCDKLLCDLELIEERVGGYEIMHRSHNSEKNG